MIPKTVSTLCRQINDLDVEELDILRQYVQFRFNELAGRNNVKAFWHAVENPPQPQLKLTPAPEAPVDAS